MEHFKVANRYTRALLQLAMEKNVLEKAYDDLAQLNRAIEHSLEFQQFLVNPLLPQKDQLTIVQELFEQKINPLVYQFIQFLIRKKRLAILPEVCGLFVQYYLDVKNIMPIEMKTHTAVAEEITESVRQLFAKRLGKTIQIEKSIASELLGGIRLRLHDFIYDATLQTQLKRFKENFVTD